ncbi:MAG: HK97-gp10 family putative phage morphogenesis protein [Amaricoccus sp.]
MADNGLARFQHRMAAIPKAARAAVKPALVKGADEIAGAARRLAPVDSGDLRASIAVTGPGETTPPYSQPGGRRTLTELQAAVTAGDSKVRYAHLVEFGTEHTQPQPYFWPAFRSYRKRAANRIKRAISKAIKDAR